MAFYTDWGEIQVSQIPFIPARYPAYLEKQFMNPFRYRLNHQLIPAFGVYALVCTIVCSFLINGDNMANLPYVIGGGVSILVLFAAMMIYIKRTARRELAVEIASFDLDYSRIPRQESYEIKYDDGIVELGRDGYTYRGEFATYDSAKARIVTSHMFNRVWIALRLGEDEKTAVFLHLEPDVLAAIYELKIPLSNKKELNYLLRDPKLAMAQIYETGKFVILD